MSRLIFLGPPGAGKGTQAEILADLRQIPHISTGEILREAIQKETDLGKKAQNYVAQGELVPDNLILDLIRERLQQPDVRSGWILDGFPRNVNQASFLDQLLAQLEQNCDYAVNLEVPEDVLITRLLARGRKDDNEQTIKRRLEVYHQETAPVIDYYRQRKILQSINGDRQLEEITVSLQQILGDF